MRIAYREVADLAGAAVWLRELGARTVVLDVEPLIAGWDTDSAQLRLGVDDAVALLAEVPGLEVVGFATNSLRRLPGAMPGGAAFFVTAARKPLLTGPYRDLPRPAVLVGDQLATDGLLAWRLGFAFAHLHHPPTRRPWGPTALRLLGRPLRRLLFRPGPA
jgi:predicted HAD superfamily phosphohydrolase YqeG